MDITSYISFQHVSALKEITKPLFELLGITYFEFYRVYRDGGRVILSTNPEWDIHFFKSRYYECTPFEGDPALYKPGYKLWDNTPAVEPANILANKDATENFHFDHGLSILKVHEDYMDLFELATTPGNEAIASTYLAEIVYIEKFISYFLKTFSPVINRAEKRKIYVPLIEEGIISNIDSINLMTPQDIALDQMLASGAGFCVKGRMINFSRREVQCLKGLIRGRSAKRIAADLLISHRTVEEYIENIKLKIGCSRRDELMEMLLDDKETMDLLL